MRRRVMLSGGMEERMQDEQVSRRRFLSTGAGLGAAVTVAGTVARAADDDGPVLDEEVTLHAFPLTRHPELKEIGGWTVTELEDGTSIILARTEQDSFICFTSECTHQNCDVMYNHKGKRFDCPCHLSSFDLDGKPVGGPAKKPLTRFNCGLGVVVEQPE